MMFTDFHNVKWHLLFSGGMGGVAENLSSASLDWFSTS